MSKNSQQAPTAWEIGSDYICKTSVKPPPQTYHDQAFIKSELDWASSPGRLKLA